MQSINLIRFGVLGDEDIKCLSVALINNPSLREFQGTVYDPCLGCVNAQTLCGTCAKDIWKCPGHFGHIALDCRIILFWKEAVKFLKCFCHLCGRLLSSAHGVFDACVEPLSKLTECEFCRAKTRDYKLIFGNEVYIQTWTRKERIARRLPVSEIEAIFGKVDDRDLISLGLDPRRTHPRNLVLSVFPVIPICCRPKVSVGDVFYDDDLSISLSQIIKLTWRVKQAATEQARAAAVMQLQLKILYYCNNSKGRDIHSSNNKVMLGIRERISKKTGLIRQNIMGKRSDYTARSVVGPHPTLELDEVAVPIGIADVLTIPECVTPFNRTRLNALVAAGRAPFVTRVSGVKISTARFCRLGSTILKHGDLVNGEKVHDCNMAVTPGSLITRDGRTFPYEEKINPVVLDDGDVVHRYLEDGDPIILNRQPTLHKNSMMGMRVKRWPGKTICVNLAITAGFNMDFDGDEGNLNLPQSPEALAEVKYLMNAKQHVVSTQTNKATVIIVQDSLLGAYLMTRRDNPMTRDEFYDCLFRVKHDYALTRATRFTSRQLWHFLFPADFHYRQKGLNIQFGRLISGTLTKNHLKLGGNSLIRVLFLEYGPDFVNDFVTNVQRMVTAYLMHYPHSISIQDCLISSSARQQIDESIDTHLREAALGERVAPLAVRERKISEALNKAKDIGNRIAKDHLAADNNLAAMVESGSKGDYFNLSQIMGLLGQQHVSGARMRKDIDHRYRTLPYYPRVIFDDATFESHGFVRSSFIRGLNPIELFFHTKAGREGIIDTSHRTGSTGYMERKMVKIAEDLVVHYDGTVRDGRRNIIQLLYGNYGFDPMVTVEGRVPVPVDAVRLGRRLDPFGEQPLSPAFVAELLDEMRLGTAFTPALVQTRYGGLFREKMREKLDGVRLSPDRLEAFRTALLAKFRSAIVCPGEPVGILAAQSIGEQQTQQMLNTFHTAGKLQHNTGRVSEILNMTKSSKSSYTKLFFRDRPDPETARYRMRDVVHLTAGDLTRTAEVRDGRLLLTLDVAKVYKHRVFSALVAERLSGRALDELTVEAPAAEGWAGVRVAGIRGITDYSLQHEDDEWYVVLEGSNLAELVVLDFVDGRRLYSNNLWEVYETFGVGAVRRQILDELVQHCNTNLCHLSLMADLMTFYGKPMAVDRYTMRQSTVGPLSKATFEESMDILTSAAICSETETICGVSASIMMGNRIKMGTGFVDLKYAA